MRKIPVVLALIGVFVLGVLTGLWWERGSFPIRREPHLGGPLEYCLDLPPGDSAQPTPICLDLPWDIRSTRVPAKEDAGSQTGQTQSECNVPGVDQPHIIIVNSSLYALTVQLQGPQSFPPLVIGPSSASREWPVPAGAYILTATYPGFPRSRPYVGSYSFQKTCVYTISVTPTYSP